MREWNDDIVFLHKIVPGSADRSYGIHVARLAGVPKDVVKRADEILTDLEGDGGGEGRGTSDEGVDTPIHSSALRRKKTGILPGVADEESQSDEKSVTRNSPFAKQILPGGMQLSLFGSLNHPILDDLAALDLTALSPDKIVKLVASWKASLNAERGFPAKR